MYFWLNWGIVNSTVKFNSSGLVKEAEQGHPKQPTLKTEKDKENGNEYFDECSISDFSFSNLEKQKSKALGKYDPKYENLVVVPGLNHKARCKNQNCLSITNKTNKTWVRKGMGSFDLAEDRYDNKCVACGEEIDAESILTFGITRAKVSIAGRKRVDNKNGKGMTTEKVAFTIEEREGKFIEFDDAD